MNKFYLHKVDEHYFKTYKDTIILDLDKIKRGNRYYQGILKKYPKHLKVIGKDNVDFWNYSLSYGDFPIKDVTICTDFLTYKIPFHGFINVSQLKIEEQAKEVHIVNNLGLGNLKNIIIPFSIKLFENCVITRKDLKTLTIYNGKDNIMIELDKVLSEKVFNIKANKKDDILNIKISSDNIDIEYNVYLKDNKLSFDKKYNKYEIDASKYNEECDELNIIELKNKYNKISFIGHFFYVRKVILSKTDINYLTKDLFRFLNEIEIIEENDMSLLPRKINLSLNKEEHEYIDKIELLDNALLIKTDNSFTNKKYIIINKDLSIINIKIPLFKSIIFDYNINNFKYENHILTIPFNKYINNTTNSTIINDFIRKTVEIIVFKNDKKYKIETKNLSDIKYLNKHEFRTEYLKESLINDEKYYKTIDIYNDNNYIQPVTITGGKVYKKEFINPKIPRIR